eukprot:4523697-Alexandrium_andersonii.AAC.1
MSASLVGSEMCIRDRASGFSAHASSVSARFGTPTKDSRARAAMRRPGAVSYTHLTLPTICSV